MNNLYKQYVYTIITQLEILKIKIEKKGEFQGSSYF